MSSKRPTDTERPARRQPAEEPGGDPCELVIDIDLEGVRAEPLAALSLGQTLSVELRSERGFRAAVCVAPDGRPIGALAAFPGLTGLLNCLERGHRYAVTITALGSSSCHVTGGLLRA
jgi:hypothetical protein